jgi:glycosyltransferase involved in cell wall biosynthesis
MKMKVLIVCSGNSGKVAPFIAEQSEAIRKQGVEVDFFLINGKGLWGYLKNLKPFHEKLKKNNIGIIHAHYGLSGLFANLQRKIPVITTFHGSDINQRKIRILSRLAIKLSVYNIFISGKLALLARAKKKYTVIPCGIDMHTFFQMEKSEARRKMDFELKDKIVLFSGSFKDKAKNFALAEAALRLIAQNIRLIELKGYSRTEVNILMNASDVALMTSLKEGSPQFLKEAMASNLPIVTTDVGDASIITGNIEGCYITTFDPMDVARKIKLALAFGKRTNGRDQISQLDNKIISEKILKIYRSISYA